MQDKDLLIQDIRKLFHETYFQEIAPLMRDYEKQRQYKLLVLYISEAVLAVIAILLGITLYREFINNDVSYWVYFLFLVLFLMVSIPYSMNRKFSRSLKISCMLPIAKAFGNLRWYNRNIANFSLEDVNDNDKLRESELFANYNRRGDDDLFVGEYKGVKFTISETTLAYISEGGRTRRVELIFKGVIIDFKANKNIKNKTIIATKSDGKIKNSYISLSTILLMILLIVVGVILHCWNIVFYSAIPLLFFAAGAIISKSKKKVEVLNEIKLEDPEFNKKYKAYSSDEVEGRYLITPSFMDRFNNIKTAFGAKGVKCSFYGDNLMFAISSYKNLFEVGNLFTPLNSPKQLETFFAELSSILNLIDYFKLDEKTGL